MRLFLLLITYFTRKSMQQKCEADDHSDGCSIPLGIDTPFKETFTKACNKHDICYGCGYHHHWSRAECDESFLRDMKILCQPKLISRKRRFMEAFMELWGFFHNISKEEKRCRMMADVYYDGVRMFAESHYEKLDNNYCNSTCAKLHGSPFIPLKRI